ncbi:uncharacterized protein [Cherax quadricarinatus]|uniref:uncharacterized protein n=1 Tax=Cherax quadricarinatus TaxID=27406 RepID=UPI00387EC3D1
MAAQCHRKPGQREQMPTPVDQQLGPVVQETDAAERQASCSWSEEVDKAEVETDSCATLPVGTWPKQTTNDDGEPVMQQDVMLDEVLNTFLSEVEGSLHDEQRGCSLEETTVSSGRGKTVCNEGKKQTVVAEVHRACMEEVTCGDGGSRKRAAGTSDMEDVLTPGQRPGKKSWKPKLDLPESGCSGAEVLKGSKDKGGDWTDKVTNGALVSSQVTRVPFQGGGASRLYCHNSWL